MKPLNYCLNCLLEIVDDEWELVVLLQDRIILRCPKCKTIHNYYSNGTIKMKKMEE